MAKKIKTVNQFGAVTGTATATEIKAPGDETPKVKTKKDGSPRKVREPRVVDERMVDLLKLQAVSMNGWVAAQTTARQDLRDLIELEAKTAKSVARAEKKLLAMNPEEQAWMAKAMAAKLVAAGAPELEQQP